MSIPVEDLVTIENASEKLATALNKGDISAISDMFSPNAVVLAPARNMAKGGSIMEFLRNMALQNEGVRLLSTEMEPFGENAVRDLGTLSLRIKRQKGERVFYKYMMLWQKVGSEWKLSTMIWNRAAMQKPNRAQANAQASAQAAGQGTGEM